MHNALITAGAVIACCLTLLAEGGAFAGDSGALDTTRKNFSSQSIESDPSGKMLTLSDALSRTLSSSAEFGAFSLEVTAVEAEALQAGLRPNPEFSLEMENIAGSGGSSGLDNAETTALLSQRLELGGKRTLRRELGRRSHRSARKELDVLKNEVLARTVERFYAVLSAQKRVDLAGEQIDLASHILDAVKQRVDLGKSPAVEIVRFKNILTTAQTRRETARQELAASRAALASAWGDAPPDFDAVEGDFEDLSPLPQWAELEQQIGNTPSSQFAASDAMVAEQAVELADAGRIPDLTVSLGVKNIQETGDNAAVAGISIPLPLFNRNQGEIRSARARFAKAREDERRIRRDVRAALADRFHRLRAMEHEAVALRDEILPAEKMAFEAVNYGYRSGKFGFLEVLDAEQSLFEARYRYIDVLTAYHQLYAQMENVLGKYDPKGK